MHGGVIPHSLVHLPILLLAFQRLWLVLCHCLHCLPGRVHHERNCLQNLHLFHCWLSLLHVHQCVSFVPERLLPGGEYVRGLQRHHWMPGLLRTEHLQPLQRRLLPQLRRWPLLHLQYHHSRMHLLCFANYLQGLPGQLRAKRRQLHRTEEHKFPALLRAETGD